MKLPSHFLTACLVFGACLIVCGGYAQQPGRSSPGADSWEADRQASLAIRKKLVAVPEFKDYLTKCSRRILAKNINPKGSRTLFAILARFKLNDNGTISEVEISGDTNAPSAPFILKAIRECSPFPKWPKRMRSAVGKPFLEIYIDYGCVPPPGTR